MIFPNTLRSFKYSVRGFNHAQASCIKSLRAKDGEIGLFYLR